MNYDELKRAEYAKAIDKGDDMPPMWAAKLLIAIAFSVLIGAVLWGVFDLHQQKAVGSCPGVGLPALRN